MLNNSRSCPQVARSHRRIVTALALSSVLFLQLIAPVVFAVNLGTVGTAVTQNFDGMTNPTTATATLPTDYKVDKGGTRRSPGAYSTALTATEILDGVPPNSGTGGIYNWGAGTTDTGPDRAVGFLGSGSVNGGNLYAKYTNTTGASLTGLRISYDVEKYRKGTNAAGYRFQLFYSTTGAAGSWTSAGANFLTAFPGPDTDNLGYTTAPGVTVPVSNQLLSLPTPIANNADIYLAWNYGVTTGTTDTNAQGLGIDNISVTPLGGALNTSGTTTTDIQGTDDGGFAVALQPDGKTVVGGYAVNGSGNKDFALVRYNYNGTLDTTFNGTGKVVTDFSGTDDRIWGLAVQTDGKIVAVGQTFNVSFSNGDIALARYNSNGTLDTTFNGTGKVVTDHGPGSNNIAYGVAMSGTNIIVAGTESVNGNQDFMVARYTTLGVLDATFGTLGVTTTGFSGGTDVARAVAIQADGKIVLGGYSVDDFAVARYTTAGALDTTFVAGEGKAAIDIHGGQDQAFGIAINPTTGSIVLAGSAFNGSDKDFALVRYTSAGILDSTFNPGANYGIVTTDFGGTSDIVNSVVLQPDGKIVVAGLSRYSATGDDFALARYTTTGVLDTTFDGDGKLTTAISTADDRAYGVGIEFDGKIVAAGFATVAGSSPVTRNFALARYNSNGSLDSTTNTPATPTNLALTMNDSLDSVVVGDQYYYTLTVVNKGPGPASNVVLTDTLPADVTYVGSTPSKGTVNVVGTTLTHTIGTMSVGETVTLTITLGTSVAKLVTNTATVTSTETDANPANNTASEPTRIIAVANVTFSTPAVIGGCENPTGTVTLSGNASTGGVTVTLISSDPSAASVPASVFVPEGDNTANFPITTSSVAQTKTPGIKATLGTSNWSRKLTVNPGICN